MRWIGGGVDRRYLEQRRQGWYCVVDVPARLVAAIGRKRLRRTLETPDLLTAIQRRDSVLADFRAQLRAAEAKTDNTDLMREAMTIRERLESPEPESVAVSADGHEFEARARDFTEEIVGAWARDARRRGHRDLGPYIAVAEGSSLPLQTLETPWLAEEDIEARSKGDHRRALHALVSWCEGNSVTPTVEAIDRRAAGRYVTSLRSSSLSPATIGKHLWSLSSLWRWLLAKGYAENNPWIGHRIGGGGRSTRDQEPERPFTDAEVATLLAKAPDNTLRDLMTLAALSGMRIEEIALLRVRDIDTTAKAASVTANPKTPASRRVVPIHSVAWPAVADRLQGKETDAFLFHEWGPSPSSGRQRSMAVSKRFGRFRAAVGVDETRAGRRRSLVNFHSFRRWFITKAEQAGQPESIIKAVVGHKRAGVTLGTYSGGPSLGQRRECVESVRVP